MRDRICGVITNRRPLAVTREKAGDVDFAKAFTKRVVGTMKKGRAKIPGRFRP